MRFGSQGICRLGLGLWIALAAGCSEKKQAMATREDCAKVAQHIADLIIADAKANPDALWDGVHASGDPEIPPAVTKAMFKAWIDGSEGQTWMMKRRGQVLAATQQGIDGCVKNATKKQADCLLDAKTKAEVDACDMARVAAARAASEAGSGSGGTAGSASAGSAATTGSAAAGSGSATP